MLFEPKTQQGHSAQTEGKKNKSEKKASNKISESSSLLPLKRNDNIKRELPKEERRNRGERWSQSRKSANFAIEGLEKEWPCAQHPLHVAHWRRQAAPEEVHLAKPAWAATATRGKRGRRSRPNRQGRARGNRARRRRRAKTHSFAG